MKISTSSINKPVLLALAVAVLAVSSPAQSGRGRKRVEPPPPPPAPEKALVIPAGGGIESQEIDGLNSRVTLKNGLTIVLSEDHSKPLISAVACVKVGYANDGESPAGLARVAGELFWRGTISRGGIPAQTEMQAIGASSSARIGADRTFFQLLAPADQAERAAQLVIDAFARPNLDQTEIQRAIRLVAAEDGARAADGESSSAEKGLDLVYGEHWMHRSRSVPEETLHAITKEQIETFCRTYYQPGNATFVLAGDFSSVQLLPLLQKGFGEVKAQKNVPKLAGVLGEQTALRYAAGFADGISSAYITVGYPLGQVSQADYPVLEVLRTMLTGGLSSRLGRELREGARVVASIDSELTGWGAAPAMLFHIASEPEKLDDSEVGFFTEIEKIRREVPSDGELQRAVSVMELAHYRELQRVEGRAMRLALAQTALGSYKEDFKLFAKSAAVTGEQIQKLAARIFQISKASVFECLPQTLAARAFTPEKYFETLGILVPGIKDVMIAPEQMRRGPSIEAVEQGTEKRQPAESSKFGLALLPKPVRVYPTLRGPVAFVREDPTLPILTIGVFFQGGRAIEGPNEQGLTELMLRAMMAGAKSKTKVETALRLEQLAATIQVVNEPDYFGFLLDVVSRNAGQTWGILHEIIESPAFEKDSVARVIQDQLADARTDRSDPCARPDELFWNSILPAHSYGEWRFGSEAIIKGATVDLVKAWYAKTIQHQFPLGVIVGDTEGSALVSKFFAEGFNRREPQTKLQLPIPIVGAGDHYLADTGTGAETVQVLGFLASKGEPNDAFALAVLQQIAEAKLKLELVDQAGLANSVEVERNERVLGSGIEVRIVSSPADEIAARNAATKQLGTLAAGDLGDDVVQRGSVNAETAFASQVQTHHDLALAYVRSAMFGRKPDTVDQFADRLGAVTKADVVRVLGDFFKKDRMGVGVLQGRIPPPPKAAEVKKPADPAAR